MIHQSKEVVENMTGNEMTLGRHKNPNRKDRGRILGHSNMWTKSKDPGSESGRGFRI